MDILLPEEITLNILSRLPFKSVLQCRLVCKTWQSLLRHHSFANMHLHHRLLRLDDRQYYNQSVVVPVDEVGFVYIMRLADRGCKLFYAEYDENDDQQSYKQLAMMEHPLIDAYAIVGSCNGLICLAVNHHQYGFCGPSYICNPITREYINLQILEQRCSKADCFVFGFGFLPSTNEYKVVRIYNDPVQPYVGRVQVYTVGHGSGWRNKGEIKYPLKFSSLSRRGILANGALYWLSDEELKIVSFDLADEKFCLISPPPCVRSGDDCKLQVLGGWLCIIHQKEYEFVKIWSLRKKSNRGSSSSSSRSCDMMNELDYKSYHLCVELDIGWDYFCNTELMGVYDLFGFTKSGEVLLWQWDGVLARYNLKTKTLERIADYIPSFVKLFEAIPHMNSFISLKALGEDAKNF